MHPHPARTQPAPVHLVVPGEAVNPKVGDLDRSRGVIHVRGGKGGKDRQVKLGDRLLGILRAYWQSVAWPTGLPRIPCGTPLPPPRWRREPASRCSRPNWGTGTSAPPRSTSTSPPTS